MPKPNPVQSGAPALRLSVIAPAHNEEDNIVLLVEQIEAALRPTLSETGFEILIVDDASTDQTPARVCQMQATRPYLRLISLARPKAGGGNGQSAAFKAGFAAARGELVGSLDADLQNAPADFPRLIAELERTHADFVQGDRSAARSKGDAWIRQQSSRIGRLFRRLILSDTIRDTGCSLRVMKREIATQLPLEFKGMHRFIPVTARQLGYTVVELPVAHRHRHAGEPKYGMGITKRALPGLIDCFAVRWMRSRRRTHIDITEHAPAQADAATADTHAETHA